MLRLPAVDLSVEAKFWYSNLSQIYRRYPSVYRAIYFAFNPVNLQLVVSHLRALGQIRHGHHVHHQTGPASKMLGPLSLACVGIILLPRKPGPLPLSEYVLDQVLPQLGVHLASLLLVRTFHCRGILQRQGQHQTSKSW